MSRSTWMQLLPLLLLLAAAAAVVVQRSSSRFASSAALFGMTYDIHFGIVLGLKRTSIGMYRQSPAITSKTLDFLVWILRLLVCSIVGLPVDLPPFAFFRSKVVIVPPPSDCVVVVVLPLGLLLACLSLLRCLRCAMVMVGDSVVSSQQSAHLSTGSSTGPHQ